MNHCIQHERKEEPDHPIDKGSLATSQQVDEVINAEASSFN
jgi:hypothetical protein